MEGLPKGIGDNSRRAIDDNSRRDMRQEAHLMLQQKHSIVKRMLHELSPLGDRWQQAARFLPTGKKPAGEFNQNPDGVMGLFA